MNSDQLQNFIAIVSTNPALQSKLNLCVDSSSVVEVAKEAGFLSSTLRRRSDHIDISDEELELSSGAACPGTCLGTTTCNAVMPVENRSGMELVIC